jgi:hypothetical protein
LRGRGAGAIFSLHLISPLPLINKDKDSWLMLSIRRERALSSDDIIPLRLIRTNTRYLFRSFINQPRLHKSSSLSLSSPSEEESKQKTRNRLGKKISDYCNHSCKSQRLKSVMNTFKVRNPKSRIF